MVTLGVTLKPSTSIQVSSFQNHSISYEIYTWFCCALFCCGSIMNGSMCSDIVLSFLIGFGDYTDLLW